VRGILGSPERLAQIGADLLTADEVELLSAGAGPARRGWSIDDLALLDEAAFLIDGRARAFGHVVVDEVQDLSPMQLRMVARRAPAGFLTALGDLAQATGPWGYDSWDEILPFLPQPATIAQEELTRGYRAPGQVLDLASRLLPLAAPTVRPTTSIRRGLEAPRIRSASREELVTAAYEEATAMAADGHLVGLVVPAEYRAEAIEVAVDRGDVGRLEEVGMTRPITLLAPEAAKGLEFDGVVLVEPAAIAGNDRRGLRLLYVAMTRPIRQLTMVHAEPLPEALAG
jgi:DNA helicase IV